MLDIVQRGGATREKPPEAVRGMASRLPWAWNGLCFAVPFNDATRDSARDLIYNVPPSSITGTLNWSKDNRGNPAAYLNASTGIDFADNPVHNAPTTELTAYVRMRRAGTGIASAGIFLKLYDPSVQPVVTWAIQHADAGNNTLAANLPVTTEGMVQNYWEAPGYVLSTTVWVSVFLRWRSGEIPVLDILGERGQKLTSAPAPWALGGQLIYSSTAQPLRLNTMNYTGDNYNCDYSQVMLWKRKLTDTEVQALVADPYGWYSPRRETVGVSSPYPLLAGGSSLKEVSSGQES